MILRSCSDNANDHVSRMSATWTIMLHMPRLMQSHGWCKVTSNTPRGNVAPTAVWRCRFLSQLSTFFSKIRLEFNGGTICQLQRTLHGTNVAWHSVTSETLVFPWNCCIMSYHDTSGAILQTRHDSFTSLNWATVFVIDQIHALDSESRARTHVTCEIPLQSDTSKYKAFIRERREALCAGVCGQPLCSSFPTRPYLENALWPIKNASMEFCDSKWVQEDGQKSPKASFLVKVTSSIVDDGTRCELVQIPIWPTLYRNIHGATGERHSSKVDVPEHSSAFFDRPNVLIRYAKFDVDCSSCFLYQKLSILGSAWSTRVGFACWRWSSGRSTSYATCAGSCGSRLVACRRATSKNTFSVVRKKYEAHGAAILGRTGWVSGWRSCSSGWCCTRLSRHGRRAQTCTVVGMPKQAHKSADQCCRAWTTK